MDDYGDDCRGKVAELEARLAAATEGHAEFRQMAFEQAQKWDASNAYTMQCMGEILDQLNTALLDRDEARAEVEALRAQVEQLQAERADLVRLANGIIQATAAPDALPRTIAERDVALDRAADWKQRAEKAEAQAASPEVMAAIRFLIKLAMYYKTLDGMEYNRREEAADIVEAWLSTLPTPEAQP